MRSTTPKIVVDTPRSSCSLSCALELIGDKWTLLIMRDLMYCHKSAFKDFLCSSEGIATNILANRLSKLCELNLVEKFVPSSGKLREEYRVTESGHRMAPIIETIASWGYEYISGTKNVTE